MSSKDINRLGGLNQCININVINKTSKKSPHSFAIIKVNGYAGTNNFLDYILCRYMQMKVLTVHQIYMFRNIIFTLNTLNVLSYVGLQTILIILMCVYTKNHTW